MPTTAAVLIKKWRMVNTNVSYKQTTNNTHTRQSHFLHARTPNHQHVRNECTWEQTSLAAVAQHSTTPYPVVERGPRVLFGVAHELFLRQLVVALLQLEAHVHWEGPRARVRLGILALRLVGGGGHLLRLERLLFVACCAKERCRQIARLFVPIHSLLLLVR